MFPHCTLKEDELRAYYEKISNKDVLNSLDKVNLTFTDLIHLLSPAAADSLNLMRERAAKVKKMHFGKTMRLYSPLYVSNYCINDCVYCGFKKSHHSSRKRLTLEEVIEEAKEIKTYGIDSLLLVSGEDPKAVSVEFFEEAVRELKKMFAYISIEIYPMDEAGYSRLFKAGVHGLTIYQETYNRELYAELHRAGPKRDYDGRLNAIEAGAKAGFYNIGLGVLLGLYDWRVEAASLAAHGIWLRKKYWKSKLQFSFPRITPIKDGFQVPAPVNEDELEQMMLAYRIFFEEADLFISTRESLEFRSKIVETCASHISGGSKVVPGGYAGKEAERDLGQFKVNDGSSVEDVKSKLESLGFETVFKDWDNCIGY
jgi:2-iminoacetate synthase